METPYFSEFTAPDLKHKLIIDDTGTVAYAYLIKDEKIISEVWLYNSAPPLYDNWKGLTAADFPIQNLQPNILKNIAPIENEFDVAVEWAAEDDYTSASIFIRNEPIATIFSTERPGYNYLALHDSPIAKKAPQ